MSEYQYYEFQAVDRPLTEQEMRELRACSSRAAITATRFVNHYEWGSFKGDPSAWMEKYFDAFLYLANWGTHELMIRLPRKLLDLETARLYCRDRAASARLKGDFVILELSSEEEDGTWDDDGSGWLSSLIPLRADLAAGDHRALYLAWLLSAQGREMDEDATEPPVPAGLGELTASLQAFADFLRIDRDLLHVAATASARLDAVASGTGIEQWIAALPDAKETPRTVHDLLGAAEERTEKRRREETQRAAAEEARRKQKAAEERDRYLDNLARREPMIWEQVEMLISTKQPSRYDDAVKLLCDLRDLALRDSRVSEVEARLLRLYEAHDKKPSLIERLRRAGLTKPGG